MTRLTYLFLFSVVMVSGQVEELPDTPPKANLNLDITSFSYPTFFNGEIHAYFLMDYRISETLEAELQGFYDTYLLSNRFRTSLVFKRFITEKLYVFAGIEAEFAENKVLRPPSIPRVGAVTGLGYDLNKNFLMEVKYNYQLNNSPMGAYGEPFVPMPRIYTISGKFKF